LTSACRFDCAAAQSGEHINFIVIAGLDSAIHAAAKFSKGLEAISIVASAWMRGSSPRMTKERIVLGE
jgi:hypothetical protein